MYVIAAPETQCPMEGNPRKYITDKTPVNVPETAYYTRLIGDGSLIKVTKEHLPVASRHPSQEGNQTVEGKEKKNGKS